LEKLLGREAKTNGISKRCREGGWVGIDKTEGGGVGPIYLRNAAVPGPARLDLEYEKGDNN
jgi:hypothetical protein